MTVCGSQKMKAKRMGRGVAGPLVVFTPPQNSPEKHDVSRLLQKAGDTVGHCPDCFHFLHRPPLQPGGGAGLGGLTVGCAVTH